MDTSAQLAKITDSWSPSHLKLSVQRSQAMSGMRICCVNFVPTGAASFISNQISPCAFLSTLRRKQASVSEPSAQIRYWYLPPWFAATWTSIAWNEDEVDNGRARVQHTCQVIGTTLPAV